MSSPWSLAATPAWPRIGPVLGTSTSRLQIVLVDATGGFARAYHAAPGELFVLRPDGYLGYRGDAADRDGLTGYLEATFA